MKIRAGFVSNSSSSSFVVLLPENFIETVDFDKFSEKEDFSVDNFKKFVEKFVKDSGYYYDYYERVEGEYEFYDALSDLIRPYVVANVDGGPDDGNQIVVLDREKIKKMLV